MEGAALDELRSLGLSHFEAMLVNNGFDCVQAIALLEMDDIVAMGAENNLTIKLGEKKRLVKLSEHCKTMMTQRRQSFQSNLTQSPTNQDQNALSNNEIRRRGSEGFAMVRAMSGDERPAVPMEDEEVKHEHAVAENF